MKKILIFSHNMEIGGAERALLGLLESIDYTKYSVDLFLMRHNGELLKYIPQEVHLIQEIPQYAALAVPIIDNLKKKHFLIALGRTIGKLQAKMFVKINKLSKDNAVELEYSHKYTRQYMPFMNNKEYDLAISFLTPHYLVAEKFHAKKKLAWVHTDYSVVKTDVVSELSMWSKYDDIVSISDKVATAFLSVFPSLKDKVILIDNIQPERLIRRQVAGENLVKEMQVSGDIRLLSIGRFCRAKNFDNVPDICRRIRKNKLYVTWYLIGYGSDEQLIKDKILEAGMENYVIILGKKENPYPYIRACDVYVQPSRYEGKCVTVREAQMLGKPVVITRYATSSSQLEDGVDGVIVPTDNEGCAQGIVELLQNPEKMEKLVKNCHRRNYSNQSEVEKLYRLIN